MIRATGSKPTIVEAWPKPAQKSRMENITVTVNGF